MKWICKITYKYYLCNIIIIIHFSALIHSVCNLKSALFPSILVPLTVLDVFNSLCWYDKIINYYMLWLTYRDTLILQFLSKKDYASGNMPMTLDVQTLIRDCKNNSIASVKPFGRYYIKVGMVRTRLFIPFLSAYYILHFMQPQFV